MNRSLWATRSAAGVWGAAFVLACGSHASGLLGSDSANGDDAGGTFGVAPGDDASSGFGSSSGSGHGSAAGCDPTCTAAGGACSGSKCTLSENPAKVSSATESKLQGSGSGDPAFKWLYPYDGTVFPRGLIAPTFQFAGASADAAVVHMTATNLDYTGYFTNNGTSPGLNFAVSQKAWDAAMQAVGATDTLKVSVTKVSGSTLSGPVTESWQVAQGSLRGTIYYETYDSQIIAGGSSGGAGGLAGLLGGALAESNGIGIMKITPGATQPVPLKAGCGNVCHAASADGSTLVAATTTASSASYDLKSNTQLYAAANTSLTYGGLYPDGSFLMSATNFRASENTVSQLLDTKTGAVIAAPGWDGTIKMAGTTAFSPDGKQIAFVHEDVDGHTLGRMDFDVATKKFSNLVDVAKDPGGYVAWPAFTPDGKSIIYHSGSNASFETDDEATGDVFIVDIASKTVHRLDALDGYRGSGTYLPANDPDLNFAPTVLPEAVGGYFWTVFTSHRSYGNLLASKAGPLPDQDGKLWVSAIDIGAPAGTDASHPAFYLDGQELAADNLRGFWVLPACEQNGASCASGDQCCSGFCRGSGNALTCVSKPMGCANDYESCTTASDCCNLGDECINGRCAGAPPK